MQPEKRFFPGAKVELREDGETPTVRGMAPPWDEWSPETTLPWRERFERGAFSNVPGGGVPVYVDDILVTKDHDDSQILGRTAVGTAKVKDEAKGLTYEAELSDRTYESDLLKSLKRGEYGGSSFEFIVRPNGEERTWDDDGKLWRTIKKGGAVLRQVGPVINPAFRSEVSARNDEAYKSWEAAHLAEQRQAGEAAAAREREVALAAAEAELV